MKNMLNLIFKKNNVIFYFSLLATFILIFLLLLIQKKPGPYLWGDHDFLMITVPLFKAIMEGYQFYDPRFLGGAPTSMVYGLSPLISFILNLKSPSLFNLNLFDKIHFLFFSLTLTFIFTSVSGIVELIKKLQQKSLGILELFLLSLTFAFFPHWALRMNQGHTNIIWGMVFISTFFFLLVKPKISLLSALFFIFIFINCFAENVYQIVIYLIFVLPFLYSLIRLTSWEKKNLKIWWQKITLLIFSFFGAILLHPEFFKFHLWGNSSRGFSSQKKSLIYSFISSTPNQLWQNFLMNFEHDPSLYLHEFNYSMNFISVGLIILLLFSPTTKNGGPTFFKTSGLQLIFTYLLILIFIFHPFNLDQLIFNHLPLINKFRVPERSFIPFIYFLFIWTIVTARELFPSHRLNTFGPRDKFIFLFLMTGFILTSVLKILPILQFELIVMILISSYLFYTFSKSNIFPYRPNFIVILFVLTLNHGAGYFLRINQLPSLQDFLEKNDVIKNLNLSVKQNQKSPTTISRAFFDPALLMYNPNGLWFNGIESLEGYHFTLKSFNLNYNKIFNFPVEDLRNVYMNPLTRQTNFELLSTIYHVDFLLMKNQDQSVSMIKLNPTTEARRKEIFNLDGKINLELCPRNELEIHAKGSQGFNVLLKSPTLKKCLAVLPLNYIDLMKKFNPQLKFIQNDWNQVIFPIENDQNQFLKIN
jgi:hypothetical protein